MGLFAREKERFASRFPRTTALLESETGKLFGAASIALAQGRDEWRWWGGCGRNTIFDLASLTKVLVTTTVAAVGVDRGLWGIDTAVHDIIPALKDKRLTLGHLLNHCGGFPGHEHWHLDLNTLPPAKARVEFEKRIIKAFDGDALLKKTVYSDLGFLLLGWCLERAAKAPLDALYQEWVIHPHGRQNGYANLQYLPISPDIAPTKPLSPWRGEGPLFGTVHDDNCAALGGVAAHAGLFGPAAEVLSAGRAWLAPVQATRLGPRPSGNPGAGLITAATAERFWTTSYVDGSPRTLGWDGISRDGNTSTSLRFSAAARGHLGFTGTSLWIDPDMDIIVACLTNRVLLAENQMDIAPMKVFRRSFHDTLLDELLGGKPA